MDICKKEHRHYDRFESLPVDQGGDGRHKCAACSYEKGYEKGFKRDENFNLDLDSLPESQAGKVRHKSPHAAFAQGYLDGVIEYYYRKKNTFL